MGEEGGEDLKLPQEGGEPEGGAYLKELRAEQMLDWGLYGVHLPASKPLHPQRAKFNLIVVNDNSGIFEELKLVERQSGIDLNRLFEEHKVVDPDGQGTIYPAIIVRGGVHPVDVRGQIYDISDQVLRIEKSPDDPSFQIRLLVRDPDAVRGGFHEAHTTEGAAYLPDDKLTLGKDFTLTQAVFPDQMGLPTRRAVTINNVGQLLISKPGEIIPGIKELPANKLGDSTERWMSAPSDTK